MSWWWRYGTLLIKACLQFWTRISNTFIQNKLHFQFKENYGCVFYVRVEKVLLDQALGAPSPPFCFQQQPGRGSGEVCSRG